jgi:hypothetical protein
MALEGVGYLSDPSIFSETKNDELRLAEVK